jgi:RNA polymerase sigma factor (sigma-70 family)
MESYFSMTAGWTQSFLGNENDEVLLANAKLGDERALTELWRRHGNVAHRILWRMTGNREDAEDALQETFLKSFVHLKSFDGRSRFSTWLVRIATNTALMQLRKTRRRPEVLFSGCADDFSNALSAVRDDSVDVEARFVLGEQTELLRAAVKRLHPSLRSVIELQHKHECSIEQIAKMTGLSIAAIKTRLHRARRALRELGIQNIHPRRSSACGRPCAVPSC